MNNITIYDENNDPKEYKILLIINKKFKYIIYTDLDNDNIEKNLNVAKVSSLDNINEMLPINDEEWQMIDECYKKFLNVRK